MGFPKFWNNGKNDIIFCAIPRPYVMQMLFDDFVNVKAANIFSNILFECFNKSKGLGEKEAAAIFDNFNTYNANATKGLISLISWAMVHRTQVYIVYDKTTGVIRKANGEETSKISQDYQRQDFSDTGVMFNFNCYDKVKLIKLYLGLLYGTLEAMNTQVGISKAVKFKAKDLRITQSNESNSEFVEQAKEIVEGLSRGSSVLIDKDDELEVSEIDVKPIQEATDFYTKLMAGELRVSTSFIDGIILSGMNSTGEADLEANEAGIKIFFNSIFKPACKGLFGVDVDFVTDNYRRVAAMAKNLPYIESSTAVTDEQLEGYVNYMFGDQGENNG
uniref:Portal protein n=1 Tax=Dulem virus 29 TaxID=3145747 RepID=A0AAU8AXF2_9CAUD